MMLVTLLTLAFANAMLPISAYGNHLYTVNEDATKKGTEFYVVGIDYQPGGSSQFQLNGDSDVLSDGEVCMRDAYAFQQLGINTIRVYAVSPWLNHDECMTIFNNAGIYVILDVNNPFVSLQREDTAESYNSNLLNQAFGLVDAFKYYPNTLGFFSGNEIVNDASSAETAPPYIRAFQRDIKQYIEKHANRSIPVGYSAADDLTLRTAMWEYLNCGDDISKSDFYGLNSYQWCSGTNDWANSGYQTLNDTFQYSSIPIIFSEYGCNKNTPRTFDEVTDGVYAQDGLLYTVQGGLIYEYSEEADNYGLVDIDSDGTVKFLDDFKNLKDRYSSIQPLPSNTQPDSVPAAPTCDSSLISNLSTSFNWTMDLPDCPAADMLENGSGNNNIGKLVDISNITIKYSAVDNDGNTVSASPTFSSQYTTNWQYNVQSSTLSSGASSSTTSSSSSSSSSSSASSSSKSSKNAGVAVAATTGMTFIGFLNWLL